MMQRRLQKPSPRGQASALAAAKGIPSASLKGSSPESENVQPSAGYLPHFARQTKSSLQRNVQRANDGRVPLSSVSRNLSPASSSSRSTTLGGPTKKAAHAQPNKVQAAKTPKPGFLSSFVSKRTPAAKTIPKEGSGPPSAPNRVLGISPPWQSKSKGDVVPSPKSSAGESKPVTSRPPRLTVNTSQSARSPVIEPPTSDERLGISPVWAQQPGPCREAGGQLSSGRASTPLAMGNADGTTPSSGTMATLFGVFSTHADVFVQPPLDENASNDSVEDVPLSVLVRPRESLGGVSEISDGSESVSLETSSEFDDEETSGTSESILSSLGSSAVPSQTSTSYALSLGGGDRTDYEEDDDDDDTNEALLQLPEGLRVSPREVVAPTPAKMLPQDVQTPSDEVEGSTNPLLSPPQAPAVAVEQYQHGLPSICVGRLLQGADDDSSEDMSTSTLRSDLERFLSSSILFQAADSPMSGNDADALNPSFLPLPDFPLGKGIVCAVEGGADDSFLLSDDAQPCSTSPADDTPAIDEALRMFTVEDCDSITLFADLSDVLDDESILSVVSNPLRQFVETNAAFLVESQRSLLTDPLPAEKCFGAAYIGRSCSSLSASSESLPGSLSPIKQSCIENVNASLNLSLLHPTGHEGTDLDSGGVEEQVTTVVALTAVVNLSSDSGDRASSTEISTSLHGELSPSPSEPEASIQFPGTESQGHPESSEDSALASHGAPVISVPEGPADNSVAGGIDPIGLSMDGFVQSCLDEFASEADVHLTCDDEIRALRGQVEQLTQEKLELEHLLEVAVRELVAMSGIYTSEGEAIRAINTKARVQRTYASPNV